MTSSSSTVVNLGTLQSNEIGTISGAVATDGFIEYSFSVLDAMGIYLTLEGLSDDLDLYLYQESNGSYSKIKSSDNSGTASESFFKYLSPGSYKARVNYYSRVSGDTGTSNFSLKFDSKTFQENTILPNDPGFANQWYLFNTGQGDGLDNEDIFAPEAWKIASTSPNVTVAVIDGGIQTTHPDLIGNIWLNQDEIQGNGIDDDNNGYVDDINGWNFVTNNNQVFHDSHGTHVAGIIGAEGNNSVGVAGVTWDVNLMSLDVFNTNATVSSSLYWEAVNYAVNNKARVINMSLGGTQNMTYEQYKNLYPETDALARQVLQNAVNNGCTVVIAAGNNSKGFDGNWISTPAIYSDLFEGVISVASVGNTGNPSYYTNYGSKVTIAAPGGDLSISGTTGGILNTDSQSSYSWKQGTSMAAPVVTGAISLMLGLEPDLQPAEIQTVLQKSAQQYRSLDGFVENGYFLDLEGALTMVSTIDSLSNSVYRLYNSKTGKHLFSSNQGEIDILTGEGGDWNNEGISYTSPGIGTANVYRFYVGNQNRHFYTANESERDAIIASSSFSSWLYEGAAFNCFSVDQRPDSSLAVVRYLDRSSGSHVYSTSPVEQSILDNSLNYLNEGIAWYGDLASLA